MRKLIQSIRIYTDMDINMCCVRIIYIYIYIYIYMCALVVGEEMYVFFFVCDFTPTTLTKSKQTL